MSGAFFLGFVEKAAGTGLEVLRALAVGDEGENGFLAGGAGIRQDLAHTFFPFPLPIEFVDFVGGGDIDPAGGDALLGGPAEAFRKGVAPDGLFGAGWEVELEVVPRFGARRSWCEKRGEQECIFGERRCHFTFINGWH